MEKERIFLTQQLICMLPPLALKVLGYLINWQKYESIKYFSKQMTSFMHITEEELEIAIQTLLDNKLITITKEEEQYVIYLDKKVIMSYINVPMEKVKEHLGFKLSETVTWKEKQQDSSIEDMSEADLKRLLLRIEASLAERQEVKKITKTMEEADALPF